eukprot:gnl/TRDRNA2_/TRDRNA2_189975_c0_seq1.p1 gnl/TRDRNA2_/TRDRNA2_189975_c0~~gnl/TRDRNA2_/TRDRNA2_189975_c0_seq1.p1  ORF type:complete len:528 (-),score=184.37 gnl/TRDRNA2_/TRDRNA2_189975_c0_seq1:82-1665(-)
MRLLMLFPFLHVVFVGALEISSNAVVNDLDQHGVKRGNHTGPFNVRNMIKKAHADKDSPNWSDRVNDNAEEFEGKPLPWDVEGNKEYAQKMSEQADTAKKQATEMERKALEAQKKAMKWKNKAEEVTQHFHDLKDVSAKLEKANTKLQKHNQNLKKELDAAKLANEKMANKLAEVKAGNEGADEPVSVKKVKASGDIAETDAKQEVHSKAPAKSDTKRSESVAKVASKQEASVAKADAKQEASIEKADAKQEASVEKTEADKEIRVKADTNKIEADPNRIEVTSMPTAHGMLGARPEDKAPRPLSEPEEAVHSARSGAKDVPKEDINLKDGNGMNDLNEGEPLTAAKQKLKKVLQKNAPKAPSWKERLQAQEAKAAKIAKEKQLEQAQAKAAEEAAAKVKAKVDREAAKIAKAEKEAKAVVDRAAADHKLAKTEGKRQREAIVGWDKPPSVDMLHLEANLAAAKTQVEDVQGKKERIETMCGNKFKQNMIGWDCDTDLKKFDEKIEGLKLKVTGYEEMIEAAAKYIA